MACRRRMMIAVSTWSVLATAALVIGCIYPGRVPPPAAIPFTPETPATDQFSAPPNAPHLSVTPVPEAGGTGFLWPPAAPLRQWKYIVLHHTAATTGSVASIDAAHRQRTDSEGHNWRGIGYHFVIGNGQGMGDGQVEPTFRWQEQSSGAHAGVGEYNEFGIGVCLVGNFEEAPPTPAQVAAVKRLVAALKGRCGIGTGGVLRHGEIKATECPGALFPHADVAATPAIALWPL